MSREPDHAITDAVLYEANDAIAAELERRKEVARD